MPNDTKERQRPKIILDTNAFFVPLQFRIGVPDEVEDLLKRKIEMVLLSHVKRELTILATKRSPSTRKNAEYALKLAEKCTYVEMEPLIAKPTDDVIVTAAREWKAAVFTNDRNLRKRLRDISVPVIYVRQKSHLAVDGMI
jgi:hypothetical protein